ncbi:glycosyltransferase family 4 protein [Candidatus Parcubacteria bacterium]|nr:glycosyltransferase family 4 protein [Candidatus Parcubacteria bacterium]
MIYKICFLSLGSYPLLSSSEELKYTGGAEMIQVLIGKELAKSGFRISFVTYHDKGEKKETLDEITIIKSCGVSQRLSVFKKVKILWRCLKKADSDVYIHSSGSPGIAPLYCFIHRKKYFYWLSSDRHILLKCIGKKTSLLTKIALYIDIKLADRVIVQNNFQKNIIEKKFKKKCVLIKNPITIANKISNIKKNFDNNKIILWVGTIRDIKQPKLFLKLVKALPQYKFTMIGGKDTRDPELYDQIERESKNSPNLEFLGFVPYHMIQKCYENAAFFVNVSKMEGFPNTFLEAWLNCKPVVSLNVDPDEIICKNKLGFHSRTFEQMVENVKLLLKDEKLREEMGMNGRRYVEREHDIKKIVKKIIKIFEDVNER